MKNLYSFVFIFLSILIVVTYLVLKENPKDTKISSDFLQNPTSQNEVTKTEEHDLFIQNTTAGFYYYQ